MGNELHQCEESDSKMEKLFTAISISDAAGSCSGAGYLVAVHEFLLAIWSVTWHVSLVFNGQLLHHLRLRSLSLDTWYPSLKSEEGFFRGTKGLSTLIAGSVPRSIQTPDDRRSNSRIPSTLDENTRIIISQLLNAKKLIQNYPQHDYALAEKEKQKRKFPSSPLRENFLAAPSSAPSSPAHRSLKQTEFISSQNWNISPLRLAETKTEFVLHPTCASLSATSLSSRNASPVPSPRPGRGNSRHFQISCEKFAGVSRLGERKSETSTNRVNDRERKTEQTFSFFECVPSRSRSLRKTKTLSVAADYTKHNTNHKLGIKSITDDDDALRNQIHFRCLNHIHHHLTIFFLLLFISHQPVSAALSRLNVRFTCYSCYTTKGNSIWDTCANWPFIQGDTEECSIIENLCFRLRIIDRFTGDANILQRGCAPPGVNLCKQIPFDEWQYNCSVDYCNGGHMCNGRAAYSSASPSRVLPRAGRVPYRPWNHRAFITWLLWFFNFPQRSEFPATPPDSRGRNRMFLSPRNESINLSSPFSSSSSSRPTDSEEGAGWKESRVSATPPVIPNWESHIPRTTPAPKPLFLRFLERTESFLEFRSNVPTHFAISSLVFSWCHLFRD